jgi:tetratricopeptide (TPR) repeat protein
MKRALLAAGLGIVMVAAPTPARADTLEDIFEAGNEAYVRGDYGSAARYYERLVELGVRDADVFYNLGTAYARQGRQGPAIAAFERALRIRPGDAEARRSLDRSRAIVARRRADREGEAIAESGPSLGEAIFGGLSSDALALAVLLIDLLFFASLAGLSFVRREPVRLALGIAAPLLGIALAIAGLGLAIRMGAFDEGTPAIVVRERAPIREGPRQDARERHRAHEGERAFVVAREPGWARVTLGGGRAGWIADDEIVALE